jgi:hypothetical protein
VSQDVGDRATGNEIRVAMRMFMSDLHVAAYEALHLADGADIAESTSPVTDAARLQGFDDNLASLQSQIVKGDGLFSSLSIPNVLMLDRLNVLRLRAERVIAAPDRSGLSGYFDDATRLMDLLPDQADVNQIKFFLGTLRLALHEKSPFLPGVRPGSRAAPASAASPRQVKVFLAASDSGQQAAEELAELLHNRKPGNIRVTQSWDLVGELSRQPLATARTMVESCHYGALVLVADEATLDVNGANTGNLVTGRFRLSADVEFLLGLMVGIFKLDHTFMVLPERENQQPQLPVLLNGLTRASYAPADVGQNVGAMSLACNRIMQAIREQEKTGGSGEN